MVPCRLTYEGFRYQINRDGSVHGQVNRDLAITAPGNMSPVIDADVARAVKREATRLRRNRGARERHQALTDLGLKRNRDGSYE